MVRTGWPTGPVEPEVGDEGVGTRAGNAPSS
jgi:hypothetical protein